MCRYVLFPVLALTLAVALGGCVVVPGHGYRHGPYFGGGWGYSRGRW